MSARRRGSGGGIPEELEVLKTIAQGVADTFAPYCEVVLHDLRYPERSLVFIAGDVTRRSTGAPATDLVLKALRLEGDAARDLIGYETLTRDGRQVKSSTIFVRNRRGKVVGAFCVNLDLTDLVAACKSVERLTRTRSPDIPVRETFGNAIGETLDAMVADVMQTTGKPASMLDREERLRVLKMLDDRGVFLVKGSTGFVATLMGLSRFTVYRYLQLVRAKPAARQAGPI